MSAANQGAERTDIATIPPIIRRHFFGVDDHVFGIDDHVDDHVVVGNPAPTITTAAAVGRAA